MNAPAPAPGDPAAKVPDGARPVVLLVDDDVPTRLMASGFLGRAGFDVVEAGDGLEALERLEAARSDLVLLDVEMPRLDGFETCARLRAIPGYATERRTWRRLLVIEGDASSRCGISMKGIDIVVGGSVGHMSAFMAQLGHLVVCGDAGDALGDSIYEAVLYVRGSVESLGADCVEKALTPEHVRTLASLLNRAGIEADPNGFRRYGSARRLYHFDIDEADAY